MSTVSDQSAKARAKRDEYARDLRELFTRFMDDADCRPVAGIGGTVDRNALRWLVERFFLKETGFKWK